jgi:hypothetical protein
VKMVMVSGLGRGTPSVFSNVVRHAMGPSYALGATGMEWYQRAKDAMAAFEALVRRVGGIASPAAREAIADWIRAADGPMYRYESVVRDTREAESFAPLNPTAFERSQYQNRVTKLEAWNRELAVKIKNAEDYYGILPEPVVIERLVTVPGVVTGTNWAVPVAVGVGALGLVGLLSILGK